MNHRQVLTKIENHRKKKCMSKEFMTDQYLIEKAHLNYHTLTTDLPIIERLCKKVDVVKKVYCVYSDDLSSKLSDEEISYDRYLDLLRLFLSAAESLEDYKFLNTALKSNDMLLPLGIFEKREAEENSLRLAHLVTSWEKSARGDINERS